MKFQLTFNTPDVVSQLLGEAMPYTPDGDEHIEARQLVDKFLTYGEFITVEFDTETETAVAFKSENV